MRLEYSRYEVIVVDAASTDNSREIIGRDFSSLRLVRKGKIGVGEAINCGARHAITWRRHLPFKKSVLSCGSKSGPLNDLCALLS